MVRDKRHGRSKSQVSLELRKIAAKPRNRVRRPGFKVLLEGRIPSRELRARPSIFEHLRLHLARQKSFRQYLGRVRLDFGLGVYRLRRLRRRRGKTRDRRIQAGRIRHQGLYGRYRKTRNPRRSRLGIREGEPHRQDDLRHDKGRPDETGDIENPGN